MSRRLVSRLGLLMVALATANAPAGIARIEIEPLWKGVPINQPDLWLERSGHDEISLSRLDFLLSEPVVEDAAGRRFTRANWFQLVSLTDPAEPVLIDELPDLPISAIEFTVGVSDAINAADPNQWPPSHPLHPQRSNLHWSWQGGYIFFAVEGRWRDVDAAQTGGFAFHLGNAPHRMRVRLKVEAPLAAPQTIRLGLNLEAILGDTASLDLTEQVSTHGREGDALAMNLKRNVEEAFSVETVEPLQLASFQKNAVPDGSAIGTPYRFTISRGFPIPRLPTDYPLTEERVALGRRLFADGQLSRDGRVSCASCHPAATAFADPQVFSIGLDGQKTPRHSMPLLNLAWKHAFFWDGRASSLREQALIPIQDPQEMGETLSHIEGKLAATTEYPPLFEKAFGSADVTAEKIGVAIEQFLLTLTSFDSKFDRAARGEGKLSEQEKRGFELFFTEYEPRRQQFGADCFHCHGGVFFTDHGFHNNGLDFGSDTGLAQTTGRISDTGKFATPSLRNVAVTAPYMHDGRFSTLEDVVRHYTEGVMRSDTLDPNLAKHPAPGIPLSEEDQAALVAFLRTLTDPRFDRAK